MAAALPDPKARGGTLLAHSHRRLFRERLLELASEHEALEQHVLVLESRLLDEQKSRSESTPLDFQGLDGPRPPYPSISTRHSLAEGVSSIGSASPHSIVRRESFHEKPKKTPVLQQPCLQEDKDSDDFDDDDNGSFGPNDEQMSGGSSYFAAVMTPTAEGEIEEISPVAGHSTRTVRWNDEVSLTPRTQKRLSMKSMKPTRMDKQIAEDAAREIWEFLDTDDTGSLTANTLVDVLTSLVSTKDCHIFRSEIETRLFFQEVSAKLMMRSISSEPADHPSGRLTRENFFRVMVSEPLPTFGAEVAMKVHMFREAMFSLKMSHLVVSRAHISPQALRGLYGTRRGKNLSTKCLSWLDPLVIIVVIVNAVLIGVSYDTDTEASGWDFVEFGFTGFFVLEMAIKIANQGLVDYFFGADWQWNCFDAILVVLALIDCVHTIVALSVGAETLGSDLGHLTLLRVARLIRVSRMVRLLRWRLFRELQLMVNALLYGLRTIIWAIVLLMVVSYCLALLLRQLTEDDAASYRALFSDVPTSMFTVYRCFIGDCSAQDGTPLAHHLREKHGISFAAGYLLATMVVTFGLFNLIMAVFVESTLLIAKMEDRKQRTNVVLEKLEVAHKIQRLVMGIMRGSRSSQDRRFQQGLRGHWRRFKRWLHPSDHVSHTTTFIGAHRDAISREHFDKALLEPHMQAILEELEVSMEDTSKIFDALDANGDGSLQVIELVEGLMMMRRGPADKLDMLETRAAVRNIQTQLAELQKLIRKIGCETV